MVSRTNPHAFILIVIATIAILLSSQLLQAQEDANNEEKDTFAINDWSPPGSLLTSGSLKGSIPQISHSPTNNEVVIVFNGGEGDIDTSRDPYFIRSTNNGSSWSSASAIDSDTGFSTVNLTHDHNGDTHAVWLSSLSTDVSSFSYTVTHAIKQSGSATWDTPYNTIKNETINISNASEVANAIIVESADGILDLIFEGVIDASGDPDPTLYHARSSDGGTTWGAEINVIASITAKSSEPSLVADSSGRLHLVWQESPSNSVDDIHYARYSGGSWSTPVSLSTESLVTGDSFIPSIEIENDVLHVSFMQRSSLTGGQTAYYRTCSLSSNTCTSNNHWSSLSNISSQLFDVNDAPVDIVPSLEYDDAADVMHIFFYGIRDGSTSTNEVLWQNTSCNRWSELSSITTDSSQTIYPDASIEAGSIHLAYENRSSEDIYYMQDSYSCEAGLINYLPLIIR